MASLLSLEDCLPTVAVISLMPGMRTAFLAIPEVQRLQAALRETKFYIVGGAVRDLLRNPGAIPKDIDCQVCLPTKEDIFSLVRGHYEDEEIKLQPLAVSVGSATDTLDGIDLLPAHYNFDSAAVENDVNSLMFDLDAGSLIDPFGTGFCNLSAGHFRIVASAMESLVFLPVSWKKQQWQGSTRFEDASYGSHFRRTTATGRFPRLFAESLPQGLGRESCELQVFGMGGGAWHEYSRRHIQLGNGRSSRWYVSTEASKI